MVVYRINYDLYASCSIPVVLFRDTQTVILTKNLFFFSFKLEVDFFCNN